MHLDDRVAIPVGNDVSAGFSFLRTRGGRLRGQFSWVAPLGLAARFGAGRGVDALRMAVPQTKMVPPANVRRSHCRVRSGVVCRRLSAAGRNWFTLHAAICSFWRSLN